MHPNPEKRPAGPPKSGKIQEIAVVDDSLRVPSLLSASSAGTGPAFGLPRGTIVEDDLRDVQPYPVELWPETRPVLGRSSSGEPLYPYQVAVLLGRGKPPKIDVALMKWEEYQVKVLGEQLRKEGACRGLDIRDAKFVSRLSEFRTKDQMLQWIEEVLAGQRAEKPKPAKTARERRRGEGNSPLSQRGRGGPVGY